MSKFFISVIFILIYLTNAVRNDEEAHYDNIQCKQDLDTYWNDLKQLKAWTLPFLDASTKLPPGILGGNLADLGNYDECLAIRHDMSPNRVIKGKYCIIKINLPLGNILNQPQKERMLLAMANGQPGITVAVCMPDSCSAKDIGTKYKEIWDLTVGSLLPPAKNISMTMLGLLCSTDDTGPRWEYGDIIAAIFLGIIAYSVVMCTIYDIYIRQKGEKPRHKILLTFSVYTNGLKLIATSPNADQLSCLHGIRFISMLWVILGHKYSMTVAKPLLNLKEITPWLNQVSSMFIIGAPVSVDSFFVLSGLLVAYVTLKAMDRGVKFNIPMYYLHRYIRLTPVLGIMIIIHETIFKFFGNGPYWGLAYYMMKKDCDDYWWSALLYVQNYVNPDNICLAHSWYLSVDTQLFLLSPLIIVPMWRWRHRAMWWNGLLLLGSIASPFAVAYIYQFPGFQATGGDPNYQSKYYMPTHTRYGPWLLGAILGYYMFCLKTKRAKPIKLYKSVVWFMWAAALATMLATVWGPHNFMDHDYNRIETSIYYGLFRHAWSLGLCWVIYACTQGYGGIVNWFLSLPMFQVLGRLTYTMYMLHPTLILIKVARIRTTDNFTEFDNLQDYWGDLMITFFWSIILTLTFESPMIIIEKVLFGGGKKKTQNKSLENSPEVEKTDKEK